MSTLRSTGSHARLLRVFGAALALLALASLLLAARASSAAAPGDALERDVRGWKVLVAADLRADKDLCARSIELLDAKLLDVERAVPEPALTKLRAVPIWIAREDSVTPCMCYHPSIEWLKEHGRDPRKARAVEIANAPRFLEWSKHQRSMVLHELAHAYHHLVLGYEHAGLKEAYARAVESKAYDSVLHWDGVRRRSYALENVQEFFAEASEAWLGTNDMFPFVRAELSEHDPKLAELMRSIWGG